MSNARIRAFDWLRGLAVVVMIQTHALSLLLPELRSGDFYRRLVWVDGLVAPSFILAAGFSLALVQVRGAAGGERRRRFFKSLQRVLEVIAVAVLMTAVWFPIWREPKYLLRIDILSCIGLALLAALPLFAALAARPRLLAGISLSLGVAIFFAAAFAGGLTGVPGQLLDNATGSQFPLLPWAGYVFVGGALGAVAARGDPRRLALGCVALLLVGVAVWAVAAQLKPLHPELRMTLVANHGQRTLMVSLIALALLGLERVLPALWSASRPVRFVELFGTSSLSAYFFHEVLLYRGLFGACFQCQWGKRSDWPLFWVLTVALIALTFLLCWLVGRIPERSLLLERLRQLGRSIFSARAAGSP
jgi:uncharacterized membrane protein